MVNRVYRVGGSDISSGSDCCVYLLDGRPDPGKSGAGGLALIDAGCDPGARSILANIIRLGFDPADIDTILLTHCHIDHVGGALSLKEECSALLVAHSYDAPALETGDRLMTAAFLYGVPFRPLELDVRLEGESATIPAGELPLQIVHTPGHSPGSVAAYADTGTARVLFGQDIHGPFHPDFGSDIGLWRQSMEKLLELRADVLCEGHFGVVSPADAVEAFILSYLDTFAR